MRDDLRKAIDDWKSSESSIIENKILKVVNEYEVDGEFCIVILCISIDNKIPPTIGLASFFTRGQKVQESQITNGIDLSKGDAVVFKEKAKYAEQKFIIDRDKKS